MVGITEDTSNQPVAKTWTGAWSGTGQSTASFSPAAGTLLVAMLSGSSTTSGAATGTITDSASGTWTMLVRSNVFSASVIGTTEVWCRYCAAAPGSITVKAVGTGAPGNGGQLVVRSLLGASQVQIGATGAAGGAGRAMSVACTPNRWGSWVYGCTLDFDSAAATTALANTTDINSFLDSTNGVSWDAFKSSAATVGGAVSATYGYSSPTGVGANVAIAEILAAVPDPQARLTEAVSRSLVW